MPEHHDFRMRVFYCERNRCVMLSHLEVARALERAVRRAKLPYSVSEGFSPHMRISFGAALPVGIGGLRECFDVRMTRYVPLEQALEALQDASVADLRPVDCAYVDAHAPAASVAYPRGSYEAVFSDEPSHLALPTSIEVLRKKKSRTLVVSDYLAEPPVAEGKKVSFALIALPTGSLRADAVVAELEHANPGIKAVSVMRTAQSA